MRDDNEELNVSDRESFLLREGRIIDAVKAYRERTGASLSDAKTACDFELMKLRKGGLVREPKVAAPGSLVAFALAILIALLGAIFAFLQE